MRLFPEPVAQITTKQLAEFAPVRKGRERYNHFDALPIQTFHERWIGLYAAHTAAGLHRLKQAMDRPEARENAD